MRNPQVELPPIDYRTYVAVPPERVYAAISTGEGWSSWFMSGAIMDARPGGRYVFEWEAFGGDRTTLKLEGTVVEAEAPRTLAFRWGSGHAMTLVRFTLEPRGAGTMVRAVEDGYGMTDEEVRSALQCACGWGEALTLLKFHLEHGIRYGAVPPEPV
jgi:uncharacterized protein YndB with AHSA1/START domain